MSVVSLDALRWGLKELPPLSLYVHVPWCVRKCPYCDFNSHEAKNGFDEMAYVDALLRDLEFDLPKVWGRPVRTIFIGGGTPSLLSAAAIDALLTGIRMRVKLDPEAEITLEANPGTFEIDKFQGFRDAGVNRLSIGIQSFNEAHLKALGRIHDAAEARRAVEIATGIFERVNLDLMYALPNQTLAEALSDVETAISYGVSHVSAYHLTIEPNTLFAVQVPANLPEDDESARMQEAIEQRLAEAGYLHYETSAFAKPGQQSRHNVNYWQFGDYLGIGAGAHGKLSFHDRIERFMRAKQPAAYLKAVADGVPNQSLHSVDKADLPFEFMMNLMRLTGGFESRLFQERTGLPLIKIEAELKQAEARGLIARDLATIRPTELGQRFLNDLLTLFLKEGD
ncbi:oxygen-independent coproporphyrinogen-3 oxidase [Crenobacter luteus]|uniref:radical SAM family heme chaperone HemW n=1 Tax=Crenobacter luteus TaxID=1452487 RepID=UPI001053922A|nr:radical SAM family heme chaperone HemW [Crenobacter luteus]TCP14810.1 oxygen-independent coproporphyrinogen-3 oxidase [Crenobacter luteus]